jgi:hypothetical protein
MKRINPDAEILSAVIMLNTWLAGAYLIIKRISPAILIKEMPMSWFYS